MTDTKFLQNIFREAGIAAAVIDSHRQIVWINRVCRQAFGNVTNQYCNTVFGDAQKCAACPVEKAHALGTVTETAFWNSEGVFVCSLLFPLENGETLLLHCAEERPPLEAVQNFNKFLIRLDKEKIEFNSQFAHELKSPLAVIRTSSELLEMENPHLQQPLADIRREVDRAANLIDKFMQLTKVNLQHGTHATIDPTVAISEIIGKYRPLARQREQKIDFASTVNSGERVAAQMEIVFKNLIENAVMHSQAGAIRVELDTLPGDKIQFAVTDSGPAIPRELRTKIWQRFFRGDDAPGGTGLGLHLVERIIDQEDGAIDLKVTRDHNKFVARVPLYKTDDVPPRASTK